MPLKKRPPVLTPRQLDEYNQTRSYYASNRRAYFKDCLRIQHRDSGQASLAPFILNPAQESLLQLIEKIEAFNRKTGRKAVDIVIYKPRKNGMSTFVEGFMDHMSEFRPHTTGLVMAHRLDGAQNIAAITKRFFRHFPHEMAHLKVSMDRISDGLFQWGEWQGRDWDSKMIIASSKDEGVARGYSFDVVHLSEVAHFQNSDAISAAKNAMMPAHYCFEESTPNGIDHSFYQSWHSAMSFEDVEAFHEENGHFPPRWNEKYRFFWPWFQDPHYTIELTKTEEEFLEQDMSDEERAIMERHDLTYGQMRWRRHTIKTKCSEQRRMAAEDFFRQEYPGTPTEGFVVSGNRVFHEAKLISMEDRARERKPEWHGKMQLLGRGEATLVKSDSRNHNWSQLVIWKKPVPGRSYVIGADAAEGRTMEGTRPEGDYGVVSVFDRTNGIRMVEVARFRWKCAARDLGEVAYYLHRLYNEAYVIAEANPPGNATCQRLVELGCAKMYHRVDEEYVGAEPPPDAFRPGFRTMKNTKRLIVEHAMSALRQNEIELCHMDAIQEWRAFSNEDGKMQAPPGETDDCVMADCMAVYAHRSAAPPVFTPREEKQIAKAVTPEERADAENKALWDTIRAMQKKADKQHRRSKKKQAKKRALPTLSRW